MTLACSPLIKNGTRLRNPCGLIAASFFTDKIKLSSLASSPTTVSMSEKDIAWEYDRTYNFLQPSEFKKSSTGYATNVGCAAAGMRTDCKTYYSSDDGMFYYYWYPRDDDTYYLYEMFPNNITPMEGVTNEHFIVWMKPAALPTFRKLYGKISRASGSSNDFKKGDVLTFSITTNYYVKSFQGSKSLVLSTKGPFGAPNVNIGISYLVCGCLCGFLGLVFLFAQLIRPRALGSKELLKWE